MKKEQQRQVVVYTKGNGAQPAWSIHLYCRGMYNLYCIHAAALTFIDATTGCHTNYHNNFSVCKDVRTYYTERPTYIQVGEHQYVEGQLIGLWTGQMLLGWYSLSVVSTVLESAHGFYRFSASNAARLYEMSQVGTYLQENDWPFGSRLTTHHVGTHSPYGPFSTIINATTQFFKCHIPVIDLKQLWRSVMSISLSTDNQMLFNMYVTSVVAFLRLRVNIVREFSTRSWCSHILIDLLRQMSSNCWRWH